MHRTKQQHVRSYSGRTYIHTCQPYVHTLHDFTNNASLAWHSLQ